MSDQKRLPPRVSMALEISAENFWVTVGMILGPSRSHNVVMARRQAIHALHNMGFSEPEIGRFIQKHHTSVHYHLHHPVPDLQRPQQKQLDQMSAEETEAAVWAAWCERFKPFKIR